MTGEVPLLDGDELLIGVSKLVFWAQEFPDRESALTHYKQRGEKIQPTVQDR